jgi:hypothetical protein
VLERLEFHYVPKHASWLNMVEIEIGVLRGQCLDRRIGTRQRLESEIRAWERQRNATRARIKWMFTIDKARTKMGHATILQRGPHGSVPQMPTQGSVTDRGPPCGSIVAAESDVRWHSKGIGRAYRCGILA